MTADLQTPGPFRILSFDGGGVHAVSYLPLVQHLEEHLGQGVAESQEFQMLIGTSTGSIVATFLKLACPAEEILGLYRQHAKSIFRSLRGAPARVFYKYRSKRLRRVVANYLCRYTGMSRDITWEELAAQSSFPELELIVTLWDCRRERRAFLSTNPDRAGQATTLWQAPVADIVTACCSAPYYFPPRLFRAADGEEMVLCDGGVTGLNNPAAFGLSLVAKRLQSGNRLADVISFGAGEEIAEISTKEIGRRWVKGVALSAINALMKSSQGLMDRFQFVFGSMMPMHRFLRTNQLRCGALDDVACIPVLAQNFERGRVFFHLFSYQGGETRKQTDVASQETLQLLWRDEFNLPGKANPPQRTGAAAIALRTDDAAIALRADHSPAVRSCELLPGFFRKLVIGALPHNAILLFLGVIVALVLYIFAYRTAREAETKANVAGRIARIETLATLAMQQSNSQRAGLLALEALASQERLSKEFEDLLSKEGNQELRRQADAPLRSIYYALGHALRPPDSSYTLPRKPDKDKEDKVIVPWLRFDPQGRLAVIGKDDVQLWSLEKSNVTPIVWAKPVSERYTAAVFHAAENKFIAVAESGIVRSWDPGQPGQPPQTIADVGAHKHAAIRPDCNMLALADGKAARVSLWDLTAKRRAEMSRLLNPPLPVKSLTFSPDGQRLAAIPQMGHRVFVWDLKEPDDRPKSTEIKKLASVAFAANGQTLAIGSDMNAFLWDPAQPQTAPIPLFQEDASTEDEPDGVFRGLSVSGDGKLLAGGCTDTTIWLWDVSDASKPKARKTLRGHTGAVSQLAFRADGQWLATADDKGAVRIWELDSPGVFTGHQGRVLALAFHPTRPGVFVSGGTDGKVLRWEQKASASPTEVAHHRGGWVWSVRFSPDGEMLAWAGHWKTKPNDEDGKVAEDDKTGDQGRADEDVGFVHVRDLRSSNTISLPHSLGVNTLAFSADGKHLATGTTQKREGGKVVIPSAIRLWNLSDGRVVHERTLNPPVMSLAFSPRSHGLLASGLLVHAGESGVWLWDFDRRTDDATASKGGAKVSKPDAKMTAVRPPYGVWSAAFHPDGQRLAATSWDGIVRTWDVEKPGKPWREFEGHSGPSISLAVSADGKWLASGDLSGEIRLWDLQDPTAPARVLPGHRGPVWSLAFSSDGRLASGGDDKKIMMWQTDTQKLADVLRHRIWRNLTESEWTEFVESDVETYKQTIPWLPQRTRDVTKPALPSGN